MSQYRVISAFVERGANGQPTGRRPQPGEIVTLGAAEADRLTKALCVVPHIEKKIETATIAAPEVRKDAARSNRTVNRRTRKS